MPSLFISCVSNEFGGYRDMLRRDLTRPTLDTKIQEDFIANGDVTLEKLDEYIQNCEAVIHIIGDMTGSIANQSSLQYITNKYKDFASRFSQLKTVLEGNEKLSYTQWEAYLAIYHNKRLFIAAPSITAKKDEKYIKDDIQIEHQKKHLARLRELGRYIEISFNNNDQLVKDLYRSKLGDILNTIPNIKPTNLPYHSIGNAFKGREKFLNDLHSELQNSTTNNISGFVIHGLGGIGKTRLAVEYAVRHKDEYTALLFINAATPELLKTNIANLSDPRIINLPEHSEQDEEVKYSAVLNWLNRYKGWLLIFDNVDTKEAAEKTEEIYVELQHGNVLITARIDSWSYQIKKGHLDVLTESDAIAFLLETTCNGRRKEDNEYELAKVITSNLGYLALALEQARAHIVTNELSFEDYNNQWEENRLTVLEWYDRQQMQYPASVAITWLTSFKQLSESAVLLLNRLSWLSSDPIPKRLLEIESPYISINDLKRAWVELKRYSLSISSSDKISFTIHKLVQDVTRARQDKSTEQHTLNMALTWMIKAFANDPANISNWTKLDPLTPHVLKLIEYSKLSNIKIAGGGLMLQLGTFFYAKAQYILAEPLLRKALEINEEFFGVNDPINIGFLGALGQLLQATFHLQEAEFLMRRALDISQKGFGEDSSKNVSSLNNLALLLKRTDRKEEGEVLMRKALAISEQTLDSNDPMIAVCLSSLSLFLQETKRSEEAVPLITKALEIDEENFGKDHHYVGVRLNNLAQILHDLNRLEEAEPLMRRVIDIFEKSYNTAHPQIAMSLNNLAALLKETNRLSEAESLFKKALLIDEETIGTNHSDYALILGNLASVFSLTNRVEEAEALMKKALEIDESTFGSNSIKIISRLNRLAKLLQDNKRFDEAELLFRRGLQVSEQNHGLDHPEVALQLSQLALFLGAANRLDEAMLVTKRSLLIFLKFSENNVANIQAVANYYMYLLQETGENQNTIKDIMSRISPHFKYTRNPNYISPDSP